MAFGGVLAVLVTLVPILARYGWDAALRSSGAAKITSVVDPSSPGFEALVSPTPTMLVLHVGPTGALASAVILARTGDAGGAAVLVPLGTEIGSDAARPVTLARLHARGGMAAVADTLGHSLRLGFTSTVTVDAAGWAQVVGPVAPIEINNPDDIVDETGEVRFQSGTVRLAAVDVEPYLRLRNDGEDDRARLFRQEQFWQAWFAQLKTAAFSGAAGESGGLGSFVTDLGAGSTEVATLPVDEVAPLEGSAADADDVGTTGSDGLSATTYTLRADEVRTMVSRIVPFPTSGRPGDRVRIRLLDGTGQRSPALEAADILVAAGAEIAVFGNATSFDVSSTSIEYYDVAQEPNARALANALGVGSPVRRDARDAVTDLTVTIGRDFRTTGTGRTSLGAIPATSALRGSDATTATSVRG